MILYYIFSFFILYNSYSNEFTLAQWNQHAKNLIEFPPLNQEHINWQNPNYSDFLTSLKPSLIKKIHYLLNLNNNTINALYLKKVLSEVNEQRVKNNLNQKNTALITIDQETTCYVWGDTHAAFHSLLRDLNWLSQENIIDNNFNIIQDNVFFIFHGDQINRGVYSIETLALIATCMKQNPNKVIYTKGNHESNKYWHNFGFKQELQIRGAAFDSAFIPYETIINTFFKTLPDQLIVRNITKPLNTILFKFNGIDEPYLNHLPLANQAESLAYLQIDNLYVKTPDHALTIETIIKTEEWTKEHRAKNGLALLDQSFGITHWAVFSAPIEIHKKYYNFNMDSFTKIIISPHDIRKSTIQPITHTLDTSEAQFITHPSRNIVTARLATEAGSEPQGKDITIGSSLAFGRSVPIMAENIKTGIAIAFNEQNIKGGIRGRHLRFDARNDNYNPYETRQNIKHALQYNITDIFLCSTGSPTLEGSIEFMENDFKILNICPITGDPLFLKPELKGLINLTGAYDTEIEAHIDHLIKDHSIKKFAFVYQIEGLISLIEIVRKILPKKGITSWVEIPYTKGTLHFNKEINMLKNNAIEAIALLGISQTVKTFIKEAGLEYLNTKILFGHSFLGDTAFRTFIQQQGIAIQLTSRVPSLSDTAIPIIDQYQKAMKENNSCPNKDSLEGYMSARFLIDMLLMCKTASKEEIVKTIEGLKNFNWHGLMLDFNPQTRTLLSRIWLETLNGAIIEKD